MTALVTGASGFIGSHLVSRLLARGDTVVALQRRPLAGNIWLPAAGGLLQCVEGDVLDADLVNRLVREKMPEEIYHLAAQSFPSVSWQQPWPTHSINVQGSINLLEAVRAVENRPSVVMASSSSIYAQRKDEAAISEADDCRPASPYGVSKLAADHFARLYAERHGLRVTCARPFFIIGPGKMGDVMSDWARIIVAIERGLASELTVGNLDVIRDFLHVHDGVEAFITIAAKGKPGEAYNISSGVGWNLGDLLKLLVGMAQKSVSVRVDQEKIRPLDERVKIGNAQKLQSLGWRPQNDVAETLREILDYWRRQDSV